jgi:hypothetical protein
MPASPLNLTVWRIEKKLGHQSAIRWFIEATGGYGAMATSPWLPRLSVIAPRRHRAERPN